MQIKFSSERFLYKTLNKDDVVEKYVDWLNDPEINRYLETRFVCQTIKSCNEFVNKMKESHEDYLFGIYDGNEHIGNIKLGFINSYHESAQLSLFIGEKSYWKKGVATEAIRALTKWGMTQLKLKKIEAGCYEENMGSLKAFLKTGYTVEGYLRKSVVSEKRRVGVFRVGISYDELLNE